MNIFGIEFRLANSNGKFVKTENCHNAMDSIGDKIEKFRCEFKEDYKNIHERIDKILTLLIEKK